VKWPGHLPAGKLYDQPVIQLDIAPTALAAARIEAPPEARFDGVNLLPYLNGEKPGTPHDALYWRFGDQMAIRQGDWKLVQYDGAVDGKRGTMSEPKLYNLASDVGEEHDLIGRHPQRAELLQAAWDKWNESNVPPRWGSRRAGRRPQTNFSRKGAKTQTARDARTD
jgi:arylsulfatase A-like enzyme